MGLIAACGDSGDSTAASGGGGVGGAGSGGSQAGTGGDTSSTGGNGSGGGGGGTGDPLFEGAFWVVEHEFADMSADGQAYGLLWEIGSEQGSVIDFYDKVIDSASELAVGECGPVTQGPPAVYNQITAGPSMALKQGGTTLIQMDNSPPRLLDYNGQAETEADALKLLESPLQLVISPGGDGIPPLTSNALGPLVDVVVPTNATCTAGTSCNLTVTLPAPVDDNLVVINAAYVCRGNPTTGAVTLSADAVDVSSNLVAETWAVKRETAMFGASTTDALLITNRQFFITKN